MEALFILFQNDFNFSENIQNKGSAYKNQYNCSEVLQSLAYITF